MGFKDTFFKKHETQQMSNYLQIKELYVKIGELTVEKDFLQNVSVKLGLSGEKK